MATCRDIITHALRQARVIGLNTTPRPAEAEAGMFQLQSLYDQWAASGMFGRLQDTLQSTDYDAQIRERVIVTDGADVELPDTLEEDEEAPPYEMSMIEVVDAGTVQRSIYDRGQWIRIEALNLSSEAPLAHKGQAGLAACLATSLAEMFGSQLGAGTLRLAASFKAAIALKAGSDAEHSGPDWY